MAATEIIKNTISFFNYPKRTPRAKKRGFTLIEFAIGAGLLILAMSLVGAGAWYVRGKIIERYDIATQKDIQDAMRNYQSLNNLNTGDACVKADLVGAGKAYEAEPLTPTGKNYTWGTTIPARGTAYVTSPDGVTPSSTDGW